MLRRAQHRLAQLHQLGVLWRFRFPVLGGGSMPWHYTLGYDGARLIAAARAEDPPHKARYQVRLERLAQSPTLRHLLGVNDFFATLAWYARDQGLRPAHQPDREGLVTWRSEAGVAQHYSKGEGRGSWIRPDGYGCWIQHGQALGCFLEYDRGTETVGRVADKLADYNGRYDVTAKYLEGMLLFWAAHPPARTRGARRAGHRAQHRPDRHRHRRPRRPARPGQRGLGAAEPARPPSAGGAAAGHPPPARRAGHRDRRHHPRRHPEHRHLS